MAFGIVQCRPTYLPLLDRVDRVARATLILSLATPSLDLDKNHHGGFPGRDDVDLTHRASIRSLQNHVAGSSQVLDRQSLAIGSGGFLGLRREIAKGLAKIPPVALEFSEQCPGVFANETPSRPVAMQKCPNPIHVLAPKISSAPCEQTAGRTYCGDFETESTILRGVSLRFLARSKLTDGQYAYG